MTFSANNPIRIGEYSTRCGEVVQILTTTAPGNFPIMGHDPNGYAMGWQADGCFFRDEAESANDIVGPTNNTTHQIATSIEAAKSITPSQVEEVIQAAHRALEDADEEPGDIDGISRADLRAFAEFRNVLDGNPKVERTVEGTYDNEIKRNEGKHV